MPRASFQTKLFLAGVSAALLTLIVAGVLFAFTLQRQTNERVERFSDIIFEAGISAPIRRPRGRDIMAACGQLKSAAEKKTRAELDRIAAEKQAQLESAAA